MSAPCAIITGVSGQDGAYLSRSSCSTSTTWVVGTTRNPSEPPARLAALGDRRPCSNSSSIPARIWLHGDSPFARHAPREVYNLAAQSSVVTALLQPYETALSNAMEPVALLEAARLDRPELRIFQAGSVQVFGPTMGASGALESLLAPANFYGSTKLFAHLAGKAYRADHMLFIASAALSAHELPLRGEEFLSRKVVKTLAAVRAGKADELRVGNLDARRDWGYAPDFVEGMHAALQADEPFDYVFATGVAQRVRDLIECAAANFGFDLAWSGQGVDEIGVDRKTSKQIVSVDPAFFRPFDETPPTLNISEARNRLGWAPRTAFETMIAQMCEADLARISDPAGERALIGSIPTTEVRG